MIVHASYYNPAAIQLRRNVKPSSEPLQNYAVQAEERWPIAEKLCKCYDEGKMCYDTMPQNIL